MTARVLIAGVSSNVGKTTVTVALTHALRKRGYRVATFKCGPDYLDPTYHRLASGRASHNLDGWMMGREAVVETFLETDADIALIEGAMGLFDGASPSSDEGSSAEIARWLQAPVLLIVDASGMARSVAALAHGYATFDPQLNVAAVFANRVGSEGHLALLKAACPRVVGGMVKATSDQFRARHLGLHAADDSLDLDVWSERLLLDLDELVALARSAPTLAATSRREVARAPKCRIGIAQDAAFSFYYPYNLRLLRELGAELVPFSPIADAALPEVDGLYIGGGYPELHAATLSANSAFLRSLRAHAERGRPIYAECGGLMYLSDAIVTLDGVRHPMACLVAGEAIMQPKLGALGYVEVETATDTILGAAGQRFRGHQFRYSRFEPRELPYQYRLTARRNDASSTEGYGRANILASYVHAHWASNPALAEAFVRACAS